MTNRDKRLKLFKETEVVVDPFAFMSAADDPELQKKFSIKAAQTHNTTAAEVEFSRLRAIDRKIRLGYFLNGFFNHGTMILMESQLKMHDRDQFEVFICDYGQANDQKGRQRAEVAADVYKPVADKEIVGIAAIAHTTASGALRAGVPVVTKIGKQFAARVASSLLHNVGMEELVASTPQKYQALALKPARDPAYLAGVQARVKNGIATGPLYDT